MRVLVFLTLGLTGCIATPRSAYRPASQVNAESVAYPFVYYEVADSAHKGSVRVASFGLNLFHLPNGRDLFAVHVRLMVTNDTDEHSWSMDPRSIRATFVTHDGEVGPAFLQVDRGPDGKVQIPHGRRRNIDVYFPLPPAASSEDPAPGFEVRWLVETGSGSVAERTRFERMRVEDADPYAADGDDGRPGSSSATDISGSVISRLTYACGCLR